MLNFLRFLKAKKEQQELKVQADLEDTRNALEEAQRYGTIPLADLKQELGL